MGEGALSKAEMGAKIWRPPNTPPRFGVVAERSAESAGVKIFAHRMKINAVSQLRVHQTPPDRSQMGISGTELSARRATSKTRRAGDHAEQSGRRVFRAPTRAADAASLDPARARSERL